MYICVANKTNSKMSSMTIQALLPSLCADEAKLKTGELYLFHPSKRSCPFNESLLGVYGGYDSEGIRLESMTRDMVHFRYGEVLPSTYCYCRHATSSEIRDYFYNLAIDEVRRYGLPKQHDTVSLSLLEEE